MDFIYLVTLRILSPHAGAIISSLQPESTRVKAAQESEKNLFSKENLVKLVPSPMMSIVPSVRKFRTTSGFTSEFRRKYRCLSTKVFNVRKKLFSLVAMFNFLAKKKKKENKQLTTKYPSFQCLVLIKFESYYRNLSLKTWFCHSFQHILSW